MFCPLCESEFRAFGTFHGRVNARCPGCFSLERHRLLYVFLKDHTDLFVRPQRVLHIAPEYYLQQRLRSVHGDGYVSGDVASPDAMRHLDVQDLPFSDKTFDVVICSHVFEHVPDDGRAMRELLRVLKPQGWGVLDAPVDDRLDGTFEDWSANTPQERQRLFGQWDHVRLYGRDYPELLRAAGFEVVVDPVPLLEAEIVRIGARCEDDHIYMCVRPEEAVGPSTLDPSTTEA
jgi:SAM-dependent methyltransferase